MGWNFESVVEGWICSECGETQITYGEFKPDACYNCVVIEKSKKETITSVFNKLAKEIYYSFNMKMELKVLQKENPQLYCDIIDFINICEKARQK